jgi:uncharacterized protein YrrD
MLRSIEQLYGHHLGALDGELGQVKDFYFDDQNWAIRYLVADTGTWLPGRQVLLSPYSLGRLDQAEMVLRVNLSRKQIENSPAIEPRKPVSRQYEEEYYRYFGWPYYWQGDALWGLSGFPVSESPPKLLADEPVAMIGPQPERAAAHLRSTQAVKGYELRTNDGAIGYVSDFMMDAQSWAIGQLVIKTGHRFSGKEVLIETKNVSRISYDESTVFATQTVAPVPSSSAANLAPVGVAG